MNISISLQTAYENKHNWTLGQNKPNSNPIKPNFRKAKMNVKLTLTKDYIKNDDFVVRINKPNLVRRRRIPKAKNERKLTYNKGLQKKRLFSSPKNKPNSNPILSAVGGFQKPKSLAVKSGHTHSERIFAKYLNLGTIVQ
ncbi:MAG TPA: hypothetical protein VMW72_23875 [Sedimentisphaerales bacterium]|nr:hypothetical protein [Sedimentisphaerales bacterium]